MAANATEKKLAELLWFCPCCFASSENGSWTSGDAVSDAMCINCGASGSGIRIPRWAVDSIREQASWVGKRYYPHDEDREIRRELKSLRKLVTSFPGRSAEKTEPKHGRECDRSCKGECGAKWDGKTWWVTQELPGGKSNTSVIVDARTSEEALAKARFDLPYVPENDLKKKK